MGVSEATTNALVSLGVPTLERARTAEILGEQLRQLSPVFDGGDASRVGKLLGAATIVSGRISAAPGNRRTAIVSVRLLDVRTGEILKSVDVEISASKLNLSATSSATAPIMKRASGSGNNVSPKQVSENSIGMKFVLIPAGSFVMGSPASERRGRPDLNNVETQHSVVLSQPFEIGMFEVTQAQYETIMGENPSHFKSPDHPVEQVTWQDVETFCNRLAELPEEKAAGNLYGLPTEAEWEYCCRAGSRSAYCFGDDLQKLSDYAWIDLKSAGTTYPVGQKKPNAWGLYDMHGNVWEWCLDWRDESTPTNATDPSGPPNGIHRVNRGGSWSDTPQYGRSAFKGWNTPDAKIDILGFRVVRKH